MQNFSLDVYFDSVIHGQIETSDGQIFTFTNASEALGQKFTHAQIAGVFIPNRQFSCFSASCTDQENSRFKTFRSIQYPGITVVVVQDVHHSFHCKPLAQEVQLQSPHRRRTPVPRTSCLLSCSSGTNRASPARRTCWHSQAHCSAQRTLVGE